MDYVANEIQKQIVKRRAGLVVECFEAARDIARSRYSELEPDDLREVELGFTQKS